MLSSSSSRSAVLSLPVSVSAQERSPIVDQIAKTYGPDLSAQVEAIRSTFNLDPAEAVPVMPGFSFLCETTRAAVRSFQRDRARRVRRAKPTRVSPIPSYNRSASARLAIQWRRTTEAHAMQDSAKEKLS